MKTVLPCLLLMIGTLMISSCGDDDDNGTTEMDFRADFFTELTPIQPNRNCAPPYSAFNNQVGEGAVMGLGSFTVTITFCVDANPGSDTFLQYVDTRGSFFFTNGDRLDFEGETGQVIPLMNDPDGYEAYFQDALTITGGTGQFEGATGSMMTDSYVNFLENGLDRTDHVWTGTIVLIN